MTWRAISARPCITVFPDGELNIQAERTEVEPFTRSAMRTAPIQRGPGGAGRGHSAGYGGERVRDAHVGGGGGERERERGERTRRPDSDSGSGDGQGQGQLMDALSSLSAEEVDTLEDILKRGRLESAGRHAEPHGGGGGGNGGSRGGGERGGSRSRAASAGVSRPPTGLE